MVDNNYKYRLPGEQAKITAGSLAAIAVFGTGLSLAFNPVAIGAAAVYAVAKTAPSAMLKIPTFREYAFNNSVKEGSFIPVDKESRVYKITDELSKEMGFKKTPDIYFVGLDTVVKMGFPIGLRKIGKKIIEQQGAMKKVFGAITGTNTLMVTRESVDDNNLSDKALRAVLAHELSHLKADNDQTQALSASLIKQTTKALLFGTALSVLAPIAGVAIPVTASLTIGLVTLGVSRVLSTYGTGYASQIMERRADRNALNVTKDLNGMMDLMQSLHSPKERINIPTVLEKMNSHPTYYPRLKNIQEVWSKVARPANDNQPETVSKFLQSATDKRIKQIQEDAWNLPIKKKAQTSKRSF